MDRRKPSTCSGCVLAELGKGFLHSEGSGRNGVLILGESAGRNEVASGLPFRPTAAAGGLLERWFRLSGFKRNDFTIFNATNCQPPLNDLAPFETAAVKHCKQYVDAVIERAQPRMILALGKAAFKAATGLTTDSIMEQRGYVHESVWGVPCIGSYHPAFLLRGAMHLMGVSLHDLRTAVRFARDGVPAPLETRYDLTPTVEQVRAYIDRLRQLPELSIAYDIETASILLQPEPDDWRQKIIIQIQFSSGIGEALVLPWDGGEMTKLAGEILALPNPKLGWNDRLSDRQALRAHNINIHGQLHDLMNAWAHLQPNFVSSKDEAHGDKGIPSKLMGLQACVSFYYPQEGCWKGTVKAPGPGLGGWYALQHRLRHYGARDADLTFRVGQKLLGSLRSKGLYDGYYCLKVEQGDALDALSDEGLPIDRERQTALRTHITEQELQLLWTMQTSVPQELQLLHPPTGYATTPASVKAIVENGYDADSPPLVELSNMRGYLVKRMMTASVPHKIEVDCVNCDGSGSIPGVKKPKKCPKCKATGKRWEKAGRIDRDEERWALALFNPSGSSSCTLNYIRYKVQEEQQSGTGHWYVPKHIDTGKETSGKAELEKLTERTDDSVLRLISKYRKLEKLGGTYCSGDWIPGDDGRVHGTFRFGTASGQISCTRPNIQQYPEHYDSKDEWISDIMKQVKGCIRAEPGYIFAKIDYRAAHARAQSWLAEDGDFFRLSDTDVHSYNTAHYKGLPDAKTLLQLDDDALRKRLKEIKREYEYDRNYKLKRVLYLMQFAGGAEKAFQILSAGFSSVLEVMELMDMIKGLFPKTFKEFPARIERELRKQPWLTSAHGCMRYFWDMDLQQATAFLPSNTFHGHAQAALVRLHKAGAFSRYGACNWAHDSLWLHCKESLVDDGIAVVKAEFEKPSETLVNSLGSFWCHADAMKGYSMNKMTDVP